MFIRFSGESLTLRNSSFLELQPDEQPIESSHLGCELFRAFSQPERNGFATGTLISPSQARRNSSRAWRVGRTEDSPDELELGRRSASRGKGRPKGQPFSDRRPSEKSFWL